MENSIDKTIDTAMKIPTDNYPESTFHFNMRRVIEGLILTTFTLNFLLLNYILPVIGMFMLLHGLRALKNQHKVFRLSFNLVCIKGALLFCDLVLNTTIFKSTVPFLKAQSQAFSVVSIFSIILEIALVFSLANAVNALISKYNINANAGSFYELIAWKAAMLVLAFIHYEGLIIAAVMLIMLVLIFRGMYRLTDELASALGLRQPETQSKSNLSEGRLTFIIVCCFAICSLLGYTYFNKYPMDFAPAVACSEKQEALCNKLVELGFPADIINDINADDLKQLEAAEEIIVRTEENEIVQPSLMLTSNPKKAILEISEIAVKLKNSSDRDKFMLIHHFEWTGDSAFKGTEAIKLTPTYVDIADGWKKAGNISGQVLYDSNGQAMSAPFYSLVESSYTSDSMFFGPRNVTDVLAEFSFPDNGNAHRGYLMYPVEAVNDGYIISSWMNYFHQQQRFIYPYTTAATRSRLGMFANRYFDIIQSALQIAPDADGKYGPL